MANFTATIPSAADNPFIKTTSLPEGTLFIVVGAILLGLAVIVAAWRGYAMYATHRAASHNEAAFTSLEPRYGGPFVDPVLAGAAVDEKKPPSRKKKVTIEDRLEEARLQGKFFSPTVEVLTRGTALPSDPRGARPLRFSVAQSGRPAAVNTAVMSDDRRGSLASYSLHDPDSAFSRQHTPTAGPAGPYTGSSRPGSTVDFVRASRPPSARYSMGYPSRLSAQPTGQSGVSGVSGAPGPGVPGASSGQRPKKLRPPSTYLNDLIG